MKIYHIACKNYFIYLLLFCIVLCSGFVFVFHFSYNYQLACLTFLVVSLYSLVFFFSLHISNNYQLPCLFFFAISTINSVFFYISNNRLPCPLTRCFDLQLSYWSCKAISFFLWLQQSAAAFSFYPSNHS